ncbi:MAG: hypothetical protein EOM62_03865, partial [Bacteroidia bacterium]|nr:hypothetical protein [Bacteroidia bacterium]
IEQVCEALRVGTPTFVPVNDARYEDGQCARVLLGKKEIAIAGAVKTDILKAWDVKAQEVFFAEVDLEALYALKVKPKAYVALDQFPAVTRDVSLSIEKTIPFERVKDVIRSLDVFVNGYPNDGGCDEGPSYWGRAGASLYQCLDLLKRATGGKFDVYDNQLIKDMGSYIYKAYIAYPYFINFADADATTGGRPSIIYHYGKDTGDPVMQKFGAFLANKQGWGEEKPGGKPDEQIMQLLYLDEIKNAEGKEALVGDFWLPETEVAGGRDKAGSSDGFFFAAKGGHNAESHNHNDLGSCVLYINGKPCLIDLGRETYTAKTFSSERYQIWTMQSQFHNLPKINGYDQLAGRNYKATNGQFSADKKQVKFSTNIAAAYPKEAGINKWVRSYQLDRGKRFVIKDQYVFNQMPENPTTLNFVAYCKVTESKPGTLILQGEDYNLELTYNSKTTKPTIESIEVTDTGLKRYWPNGVTRIVFNLKNPGLKGENQITIMNK